MTEIIINSCNFDAKELSPNLNISIEKTTTVITKKLSTSCLGKLASIYALIL